MTWLKRAVTMIQRFPEADALVVTWWGNSSITELFDYRHVITRDSSWRPLRVLTADGLMVLLTYRRDGGVPIAASLGFVLWQENLPDTDQLRLIFQDDPTTKGPTP